MLIDEASRVQEETYKSLRPMLAVGDGDLWLLSTPYRQAGFFYKAWTSLGNDWHKVKVPATECPRISKKFLEEDRGQLKNDFEREYMCEFQEDAFSLFGRELLEAALDVNVKPLIPWKR